MYRLFPRLLLLLLLSVVAPQPGRADPVDAGQFMMNLGNRVLEIINDKQSPEAKRKQQFRQLADESFEIPKIAQFVLGRYWRTASDDEKQRFVDAFETYMVQVYWSRFNGYNGESFKVMSQRDEGSGTVLVTTEILRPNSGQPPVKVSWSLVKRGDSFKIRDASLEGISQALTYRDEFSSIIERNGGKVSALISQLNERAKG
jgi:phospholipid transport system substrate-binding protein